MTDPRITAGLEQALELGEVGIQVAAYLGDELIVDAWAGVADREPDRAVDGDTLFCPFSVTKAVTATALHIQAERGLVEYQARVAEYWPEYAAHGKGETTVRDALTHRAGIPAMPDGVTPELMCDWDWMVEQTAALEPLFTPGRTNAYHSLIWGWIIGEIVCRTDPEGRDLGRFVEEEICQPLGIDDLYLGLPRSELPRVAPLITDDSPPPDTHPLAGTMPLAVHASAPVHNREDVMEACIPGAGAIMTARGGARMFAMIANGGELDGVRLLSEQRLRSLCVPRDDPYSPDARSGGLSWIGRGGYHLGGASPPANPLVGSGPYILHHPGAGGSIGWADLDAGLAAAICHNHMHGEWALETNPFQGIADAVRAVAADMA